MIPKISFGTYKLKPEDCYETILSAIKLGYRGIDTASMYKNEAEIGRAIADCGVPREELYIIGKCWSNDLDDPRRECLKTIENLQCTYLDLYLIHQPFALQGAENYPNGDFGLRRLPMHVVWGNMENLVDIGVCKAIGLGNFPAALLNDLLGYARIIPEVNQVEFHPYNASVKLQAFHDANNITTQGFGVLGGVEYAHITPDKTPLAQHELVTALAEKYTKTPYQILIAYATSRGVPVVCKSKTPSRQKENLEAIDITLEDDEINSLSKLDDNVHFYGKAFLEQIGLPLYTS